MFKKYKLSVIRMMKYVAFLALVALAIIKENKAAEVVIPACQGRDFVKAGECCKSLPVAFERQSMKNCIGNRTKGANKADMGALEAYRLYNGLRGSFNGSGCMLYCAAKEQNLLLQDGELDVNKIMKVWSSNTSSTWKTLLEQSAKICLEEIASVKNQLDAVVMPSKDCKPIPGVFITCVIHKLIINCPAEHVHKSPTCDTRLPVLKNCSSTAVVQGQIPMFRRVRVKKGKKGAKTRANTKNTNTQNANINKNANNNNNNNKNTKNGNINPKSSNTNNNKNANNNSKSSNTNNNKNANNNNNNKNANNNNNNKNTKKG